MGANNVKALKLMGDTKRKPSLKIHNQEIVAVYDPPHLQKCTWNLFMKYDVQLKSEPPGNQLPVIAKWDHILKLYELNKPSRFHLLYKVTATHLNPVAQSAMKVSLAAQVMSHMVAAGLNTLVSTGKKHCTAFSQLQYFVINENEQANFSKSLSPDCSCDQNNVIVIYYLLIL
jgi:hypothetical protein